MTRVIASYHRFITQERSATALEHRHNRAMSVDMSRLRLAASHRRGSKQTQARIWRGVQDANARSNCRCLLEIVWGSAI